MAWITIRGDRKKKYRVGWRDAAGKIQTQSFALRRDAAAFKAKIESAQGAGTCTDITLSVSDLVDDWLYAAEVTGRLGNEPVEPSTLRKYKEHGEIIKSQLGALGALEVDEARAMGFRDWLLETYSREYAKKIFTSFKSVFYQAHKKHKLAFVMGDLHIKTSRRTRADEKVVIPSIQEIGQILEAISALMGDENLGRARAWRRFGPLFTLALYSGMRPSEIRALAWRNVDFERCGVDLDQGADEFGKIGKLKSAAGYRFIALPDRALERLAGWRGHCPAGDLDLVFPNGQGKVESHSNITNRGWKVLCARAGLMDSGRARYPWYCLRHTKASLEIGLGANPKEIQKTMGHENINITLDTYGHLFKDLGRDNDRNDIVNLLENATQLRPKKSKPQHLRVVEGG